MTDEEFSRAIGRDATARPLSGAERANAEAVLASYRAFHHGWDEQAMRRVYSEDYLDHSRLHGADLDSLGRFVTGFRAAYPASAVEIVRLLVDGDMVMTQVAASLGPNHPADAAMELFRMADGRIAEHWDIIDGGQPAGPGKGG